MERVIVYIDGFNLYFGLKEKGWKRYYWLNLQMLSQLLLQKNQELVTTKYFTSRVKKPPDKNKRQTIFLEALETLENFHVFYGHYLINTIECKKCCNIFPKPNEKMTDVNIAVEILTDAFQNSYDKAIIISADSDLSGPIRKIKTFFPDKKIIVAFPPARYSFILDKIAHAFFTIGRKKFAESVFPEEVKKADGFILHKPDKWK